MSQNYHSGIGGLTLKAQTLMSRLTLGPGQKRWPRNQASGGGDRGGDVSSVETWAEARDFKETQ